MSMNAPVARRPHSSRDLGSAPGSTDLADLLERVLDKGVVIAGDITLFLGGVELLTLKIRLLVASIDKAQEIGINWWQFDPALSSRASSRAKELEQSEQERKLLKERLDRLERLLLAPPQEADQKHSAAGQRSNAATAYVLDPEGKMIAGLKRLAQQPQAEEPPQVQEPEAERNAAAAYVLDPEGRMIAELKPPAQQTQEAERPQAPERVEEPQAEQTAQPAGAALLLGPALQEHIAQAIRPVLGVVQLAVQLRSARALQLVEQGRPEGQQGAAQPREDEQNAAPAALLDQQGRVIAELKPVPEEVQRQTQERPDARDPALATDGALPLRSVSPEALALR